MEGTAGRIGREKEERETHLLQPSKGGRAASRARTHWRITTLLTIVALSLASLARETLETRDIQAWLSLAGRL